MTYASNPNQQPEKSIFDYFNKQTYLGNEYTFGVNGVSLDNESETPFALIQNPIANGNMGLFISKTVLASDEELFVRCYANPTITSAGTPFTPINTRLASPNTSVSMCTTTPTIASNGTFLFCISTTGGSASVIASLQTILDPGQTILFTGQGATDSTNFICSIIWYEI